MKRVLVAATLATLMIAGSASAGGSTTCGAALSVHNNALCAGATTLVFDGEPSLDIAVGIGPIEDVFYGDVQVTLANTPIAENATAFIQRTCAYRPTNLLAGSCTDSVGGEFAEGETLYCIGRASGVGQWNVSCDIQAG